MVGDPLIGTVLGDVILLSRIGSGAMGTVYRARSEKLDRPLAVKLIREDHTHEERERFMREGRAAAKVQSEHVVRVYASGAIDDHVYLVLELVEGESLDDRIERDGALDPWAAVHIGVDTALGLAAIHEAGIVHRDIKPANILLGLNGRAKIADLGLAKLPDNLALTATGALVGTPLYVAPEGVLDPKSLAPPADIYGLGATLYHALAGTPPYDFEDPTMVIQAKMEGPPVPLAKVRPEVPADLADLVERCMQREPALRPTAAHLSEDLSGIFLKQKLKRK
jgi:serine/threonine-protein kinase